MGDSFIIWTFQEWRQDKANKGATYATAYTKAELDAIDTQNTDYLFGLFSRGHMSYEVSRNPNQPSVADMTGKAIDVLQNDPNGFFLMVEGGRIDTAHHASRAHSAIVETQMLAKAVEVAVNKTSEADTLIIVTADHSHVMSFGGYNFKGTDPLGKFNGVILLFTGSWGNVEVYCPVVLYNSVPNDYNNLCYTDGVMQTSLSTMLMIWDHTQRLHMAMDQAMFKMRMGEEIFLDMIPLGMWITDNRAPHQWARKHTVGKMWEYMPEDQWLIFSR